MGAGQNQITEQIKKEKDTKDQLEDKLNTDPCKFNQLKLPDNVNVFAAGGYAGKPVYFQIDQSGNQTGQIDVSVNSPTKPVVLILGAYDPTIWNIGWTKGTKILAVYVSGYHRQVIAGLPKTIPSIISTYDNKSTCGYFYIKEKEENDLNPTSRRLFDRPVNMVFIANNGDVTVGSELDKNVSLIHSGDSPPSSFYDKTAPLAGALGLEQAVKLGILREATQDDAIRWAKAVKANKGLMGRLDDIPLVSGGDNLNIPDIYNGYVVLKSFTFPSGLYGAHSATFFVLRGVEIPKGNPGHSIVYNFNTLQCEGIPCGH